MTDLQVQKELDKLIAADGPAARGLTNVYFVLLPPDVDECITIGSCGTTAFPGYHSAFSLGKGLTVYAAIPDPQIEFTPPPGSDPEGNAEAESTIDTVAHEAVEAMTDPLGTGWMDPNGFETADKCENGPQQGTPLGYASDGSPYNQLINGHQYLIQDIWSNARSGCVQSSTTVASIPALHTLSLRQFSSSVSGTLGSAHRVPVIVILARAGGAVAVASGVSRADGSWGPLTLRGRGGQPHAVGDDRDVIEVLYGLDKDSPAPDFIQTGDGGNPFTESGFTGWFDLDHGYAVRSTGSHTQLLIGPCGQTGVLTLRVGSALAPSPTDQCETETDAAPITVGHVGPGTGVTMTSEDNRGGYALEPNGALVRMTVALGEPGSVSSVANHQLVFTPTGFPTCIAFLRIHAVRCSGLVPRGRYRLLRGGRTLGAGRAGKAGAVTLTGLTVRGGDVLTLVNAAGRRLTSLHVARLRIDLVGNETAVASGTCQAGDYWGTPVTSPPIGASIGVGIGNSGTICPAQRPRQGAADLRYRPDRRLLRRPDGHPGPGDPVHGTDPGRDAVRVVRGLRAVGAAGTARLGVGRRRADRAHDHAGRVPASRVSRDERRHRSGRGRARPGAGALRRHLGPARRRRRHADAHHPVRRRGLSPPPGPPPSGLQARQLAQEAQPRAQRRAGGGAERVARHGEPGAEERVEQRVGALL